MASSDQNKTIEPLGDESGEVDVEPPVNLECDLDHVLRGFIPSRGDDSHGRVTLYSSHISVDDSGKIATVIDGETDLGEPFSLKCFKGETTLTPFTDDCSLLVAAGQPPVVLEIQQ